jgi:hypothetical protein
MTLAHAVGWLLFIVGAAIWFRVWALDQRLQHFRAPLVRPSAYLFVPTRWQRRFYVADGQRVLRHVWASAVIAWILTLLGVILFNA